MSIARTNRFRFLAMLTLVAVVATTAGCSATRGRRGAPTQSGFLGDYSQLEKIDGYDAQRLFIAPDAEWSSYRAVHLDSVTMWVTPGRSQALSDDERQMLTDLLFKALHEKLSERFLMADHPGPQTIEVRAALTEAKGANVPVNAVTTVVPQLRALSTLGGLTTDVAAVVGTGTVEIEVRDSITNKRLAAAVDSRAGSKTIRNAFSKWADVEAAANYWAGRVRDFLVRQGVAQRH